MRYAYDVLVIGDDFGAVPASVRLAKSGARVAIVRQEPGVEHQQRRVRVLVQALRKAAKIAYLSKEASQYGIYTKDVEVDFREIIRYVNQMMNSIQNRREPEFFHSLGIDVFHGNPVFFSPNHLAVSGQEAPIALSANKFVIATGAVSVPPLLNGVEDEFYYTPGTVGEMTALPERLAIIGGSKVGFELAQAFARLGSRVTMLIPGDKLLSKVDDELISRLQRILTDEGIHYFLQADVQRIEAKENGKRIVYGTRGSMRALDADVLIMATEPAPAVTGLGLESAGVSYSSQGIHVDRYLRTTAKHIFAIGSVIDVFSQTSMAQDQARKVVDNIRGIWRKKLENLLVPQGLYVDPEISYMGLTEQEARSTFHQVSVERVNYNSIDLAPLEDAFEGWVKVIRDETGRIVGGHAIGEGAALLLQELSRDARGDSYSYEALQEWVNPDQQSAKSAKWQI